MGEGNVSHDHNELPEEAIPLTVSSAGGVAAATCERE